MAGVTEHGIRYPDGATAPHNFGVENKKFAEDIDLLVYEKAGPIAETIVEQEVTRQLADNQAVKDGAAAAVANEMAGKNLMRAYPETVVTPTSLTALPMQWTYKTLNAPVGQLVTETVEGAWVGSAQRAGEVPVLQDGLLDITQIPAAVALKSDIPVVPPVPAVEKDRSGRMIFFARVAKARATAAPVAVAITGSSTSAANPGYIVEMTKELQRELYPEAALTNALWSTSATFTQYTAAGLHVYSAAEGGTTASSFLNDAECDRIAALNPALIVIMVGANDYAHQRPPSNYKMDLKARLAYLDGKLTAPCTINLVHTYARPDVTPSTYKWDSYLAVLNRIASERANTVVTDISRAFSAVAVPGSDPLALVSADNIHQSPAGYSFMARMLAADLKNQGGHYA